MNIIKTTPGAASFTAFHSVLNEIYPIDSVKHRQGDKVPEHHLLNCFVFEKSGKLSARAALYYNPSLQYKNKKTFSIGCYECVDDELLAAEVWAYLKAEARKMGAVYLIGPMNGSTWEDYRMSAHNRHPNFLLEPFYPEYYLLQFSEAGFQSIAHYVSSFDSSMHSNYPEVLARKAALQAKGLHIRSLEMERFESEMALLYPFAIEAFKHNFLFTEIEQALFFGKYNAVKSFVDARYVKFAFDKNNTLVGFVFSYKDLLNPESNSLVIKTIARKAGTEWEGLGHVLANEIIAQAKVDGYQSVIHAFMIAKGSATAASQDFYGTIYKEYVLFGLAL